MPGPDRFVQSRDGTSIAVFSSGLGETAAAGPQPVLLVHGTTADHLTFRVVAPILGTRYQLHAMDRRGRGDSGDVLDAYAITREFEDVAAVADAIAAEAGGSVDVVGHSFGGRCALGASLLTTSIRRVVCYEGAPPATRDAASAYEPSWLLPALAADLANGDLEGLLERFMRTVVGMDDVGMARFRADPVWPLRVAAAPTILRELEASKDPAAGLDTLGAVTIPVLQILGSASSGTFARNTAALDQRLVDGRVTIIDGAAHGAHHTHIDAFVAAVEAFLDA
ncbi:MAG: alpha/beta hydrolase [Chloroflexota bacterium]